jgi:SMC interacting uncharacterized protein involved in chromosome segregation
MTPSRTPNTKDRSTVMPIPQTAEKEKAPVDDKAFIHQKTQQVLDELAKTGGFNDLVQKGLRTMTHKQFIAILHHFLKPIVHNAAIDSTNYIDYISNFLAGMDYPYASLSKSTLKTPSAPHCQNSIIVLLAWLSEFSSNDETLGVEHVITEDFASSEVSSMFMGKTAEAFVLWNNQENAEDVLEEIKKDFVERNVGPGKEIDQELLRLDRKINDLKKEVKPVSSQQSNDEKREERKRLKQRTDELTKIKSDLNHRVQISRQTLDTKRAAEASAAQELERLRTKLSQQKMTLEEKNQLLVAVTLAKSELASKKIAAAALKEASMEKEIQQSNLIHKKFQLIEQLNNSLYLLAGKLQIAGMHNKFDPADYEIKTKRIGDTSALDKELQHLKHGLVKLNETYKSEIAAITQNQMKIEDQKHELITQKDMKTAELANLKVSLDQVVSSLAKVEKALLQTMKDNDETAQQNAMRLKEISAEIQEFTSNIAVFTEENAQLQEQKVKLMASSLEKCKILFEQRKAEVEVQKQRLAATARFIGEFKKSQKTFPEDVQRGIEKLLKEAKENEKNPQ